MTTKHEVIDLHERGPDDPHDPWFPPSPKPPPKGATLCQLVHG